MSMRDSKSSNWEVFEEKWELGRYTDFQNARSFAIANGWRANPQKVQLRQEGDSWVIEPFERDCNCPGIVKPF